MGKLRKGSSPFARTTANELCCDGVDKHQDRATAMFVGGVLPLTSAHLRGDKRRSLTPPIG